MNTLICGSIAYDTIMVFQDRFKNHILPDQIHILNVAFLVPEMRREFGGCAGNIAYNMRLLGGRPVIMAAVLPAMLGAGLALRKANMETDTRFQMGSDATARIPEAQADGVFTYAVVPKRLSDDEVQDIHNKHDAVQQIVGLTELYRAPASDEVRLRSVVVNVIGVTGESTRVAGRVIVAMV